MDFLLDEFEADYAGTRWPCAAGLIAGTLALMTRWASPEPTARLDDAAQRQLMARKIASNLFFLREHPHVPPGLRLVATKLQASWSDLAADAAQATAERAAPPARAVAVH